MDIGIKMSLLQNKTITHINLKLKQILTLQATLQNKEEIYATRQRISFMLIHMYNYQV